MADKTTYCRMLGHVLTIAMHVGNIVYMNRGFSPEVLQDPQLKAFGKLQPRYFTVWTFVLQIINACTGLVCDYLVISNSENKLYKLPKHLRGFKNTLFSAILWPSTWVVCSIFWGLYLYDRSLIFPEFIDKALTTTSNHIMHTAIIFVVLWEVYFTPRVEPRSHRRNILHILTHLLLYLAVLFYTHMQHGVWLYPIFSLVYGTIYFPLINIAIGVIALTFYYLQWTIINYLWSDSAKTKKIT
ncbi:androgen-dependent TFPI-regulating protein-like [Bicyclus anynana]|uniref:Androgen-dependent TFPI-regulating protein-like n=1 Tax=Bicyclus anynana TaxID=110368 RepID=A0A6J1NG14_BICAN|nr:androgen-dependent TFPI-regulating protein-like [Bicyclus anynana]